MNRLGALRRALHFHLADDKRNGALVFDVLGVASHVYGIDAESDKKHNKRLKGY